MLMTFINENKKFRSSLFVCFRFVNAKNLGDCLDCVFSPNRAFVICLLAARSNSKSDLRCLVILY